MLLNITNINTKLLSIENSEIDKENLILLRRMGVLIPDKDKEKLDMLREQTDIIEKNGIYQHIKDINNQCIKILDYENGEHNLYIASLNPNYSFALDKLNGVVGYNIQNNTYLILHLKKQQTSFDKISSILVHEYHHVIRNLIHQEKQLSRKKILLDYIIEEGLAENFVAEVLGESYLNPWAKQLSLEEINANKDFLISHINNDKPELIYSALYGDQVAGIPLWLGYSFGFFFIKYLLEYRKYELYHLTEQSREYFNSYISEFFEWIKEE